MVLLHQKSQRTHSGLVFLPLIGRFRAFRSSYLPSAVFLLCGSSDQSQPLSHLKGLQGPVEAAWPPLMKTVLALLSSHPANSRRAAPQTQPSASGGSLETQAFPTGVSAPLQPTHSSRHHTGERADSTENNTSIDSRIILISSKRKKPEPEKSYIPLNLVQNVFFAPLVGIQM